MRIRRVHGADVRGDGLPIELTALFDGMPVSAAMRARLNETAERLGRNPQVSLPQALGGAGYKGLMRALSNPQVLPAEMFEAVYATTIARVDPGQQVLCIEDTTDLIFGGARGRKGLPRLESKATGFRAHVALCVSEASHAMLGVLDMEQIIRDDERKSDQSATERYNDPVKESLRWARTVERTEARIAGRATLIHVRDREADDYAQLCAMTHQSWHFVQRMRQARLLAGAPEHAPAARKVDEAMRGLTGVCEREVALSPRAQSKFDTRPAGTRRLHPARRSRQARLRFRACALDVRRPDNAPKHLPPALTLHVVHVEEIEVPPEADPVEWYLLTSEPVDTVEQVLRVVDIYRARWLIEEFNKGLQTGCQYEKLQIETAERLWTMLAFYCPIVTNLLALRALAHQNADTPASDVLDADEVDVLRAGRRELRNRTLTVQVALALIARLGGHFTHNGRPGWLILLRGMATLRERAAGWRLARLQPPSRAPP
jgi:Transposase DDE domain